MKASELIAAIQENIAKHGDKDVVVVHQRNFFSIEKVFGAIEELGENWPLHKDDDPYHILIPTGPNVYAGPSFTPPPKPKK